MHVLLTGGASFIGRHVAQALLDRGARVTATGFARPVPSRPGLEVRRFDLASDRTIEGLDRLDSVVHCAAVLSSEPPNDRLYRCNVGGTARLVRLALDRGAQRMIVCSTLSVHGDIEGGRVDHATPCRNPSAYGQSKLAAEQVLAAFEDRLPAVALRLPGVVGRGAHSAFVKRTLETILRGECVRLSNPDAAFNNVVHVTDLADYIAHLALRGSWDGLRAFPLGATDPVRMRQVVDILAEASGRRARIEEVAGQEPFTIDDDFARGFGWCGRSTASALHDYAAAEARDRGLSE